jgi:hypothetical protein
VLLQDADRGGMLYVLHAVEKDMQRCIACMRGQLYDSLNLGASS